jgi:nitroreductase
MDDLDRILDLARWYPSPHNSQPIVVHRRDDGLDLYYDLDRGLPAEPYGVPFGFVCAGTFLETFTVAAHSLGYEVTESLRYDDMDFGGSDRLHPLGSLTLAGRGRPVPDLDAELILRRRTSRLPYTDRPVAPDALHAATAEAERWGHRLRTSGDRDVVRAVVALNQLTLFRDLESDAVREEIASWLRYSRSEAERSGDGLAAETLHLPGPLLRFFVRHHRWWSLPLVGRVVRSIYLRTLRGVPQVAWISGPFTGNAEYLRAGRLFLRVWLLLTQHGVVLHPFGSVITNPRSHAELCRLVGVDEAGGMTWMLFRLGYSGTPPRSARRPLAALEVAS